MSKKNYNAKISDINSIQGGPFQSCSRIGSGKKDPLPKISHTYHAMLKLGIFVDLLKKIKKKIHQPCDSFSNFCWYQHFPIKNQQSSLHQEIQIHNLGQNICRFFHFLTQFLFTTGKARLDYYHEKVNVQAAKRIAERLKTYDLFYRKDRVMCRIVFKLWRVSKYIEILSTKFSYFLY